MFVTFPSPLAVGFRRGQFLWRSLNLLCHLHVVTSPHLSQEEKPMLAALLQQSLDKIQLTRRILDLKQVKVAQSPVSCSHRTLAFSTIAQPPAPRE